MTRAASSVLVDYLSGERTAVKDGLWIVGFGLLTALLAQVEVRFPFTPVPLTGQTFAVLLSGAVLGSRRAFASQLLYLSAGAAGLPVFSGGAGSILHLVGPTGGYLWSFPVAAGLLGWLVERGAGRRTWRLALALVSADLLILAFGALWLSGFFAVSARQAWLLGFYPFLIGDVVKVALVGASLPRVLRHYERQT
ncbi:MAG: biotin transporter BioY [Acidobacteria bacterium]|nr:biotin transporter BioY [Acidobacteriota bacterium]